MSTVGERLLARQQFEKICDTKSFEEWEDAEQQKRIGYRLVSGYRILEIDSDDTAGGPIPFLFNEMEAVITRFREIELEDKEGATSSRDERIVDCTDEFYRMTGKEYDPKKAFGNRIKEKIVRCENCVYRKENLTCKLFGTKTVQDGYCNYGKSDE